MLVCRSDQQEKGQNAPVSPTGGGTDRACCRVGTAAVQAPKIGQYGLLFFGVFDTNARPASLVRETPKRQRRFDAPAGCAQCAHALAIGRRCISFQLSASHNVVAVQHVCAFELGLPGVLTDGCWFVCFQDMSQCSFPQPSATLDGVSLALDDDDMARGVSIRLTRF